MTPLASGTLRSLHFVATVPTRTVALLEVELEGRPPLREKMVRKRRVSTDTSGRLRSSSTTVNLNLVAATMPSRQCLKRSPRGTFSSASTPWQVPPLGKRPPPGEVRYGSGVVPILCYNIIAVPACLYVI